jgi:hypothetical protein
MKYYIIFSKKSIDINNNQGLVFRTICKNYFFKRKYFIYDDKNVLLCVFEKNDFLLFFTKTKIIINNLNYDFSYSKKGQTNFLKLQDNIISYKENFIGYLKSEFMLNNKIVGTINEEYEFPNNRISFNFYENNIINYSCLILFIISSTAYWDPN